MILIENKSDLIFDGTLEYFDTNNHSYNFDIKTGITYDVWTENPVNISPIKFLSISDSIIKLGETKKVQCLILGAWYFRDILSNCGKFNFGMPGKKIGELKVDRLVGYK